MLWWRSSGALVAQNQGAFGREHGHRHHHRRPGFGDSWGETVFPGEKRLCRPGACIAVLLGSVLYRLAIAMALGLEIFVLLPSRPAISI